MLAIPAFSQIQPQANRSSDIPNQYLMKYGNSSILWVKGQDLLAGINNLIITYHLYFGSAFQNLLTEVRNVLLDGGAPVNSKFTTINRSSGNSQTTTVYEQSVIKQFVISQFKPGSKEAISFELVLHATRSSTNSTHLEPPIERVQKSILASNYIFKLENLDTRSIASVGPFYFVQKSSDRSAVVNFNLTLTGDSNSWLTYFQKQQLLKGSFRMMETNMKNELITVNFSDVLITSYNTTSGRSGAITTIGVSAKSYSFQFD